MIEAVTFDAAHTLIHVDWDPARITVEAAIRTGARIDPAVGREIYLRMLQGGWRDYQELNRTGSEEDCRGYWLELTEEWLLRQGETRDRVGDIAREVQRRLKPGGDVYHVYEDVVPCLEGLLERGVRLAVISNWDFTLPGVLEDFGLAGYFEVVVASLCFGVEKPDPAIFAYALGELGVEAGAALHVGDDPMADFHGARSAGMQARIIDRSGVASASVLTDLRDLMELV